MPLVRSRQSLEKIKDQYRHGKRGHGNMEFRSYHLQPYHAAIIDMLAQDGGLSKANVVRQIIDEWCEMKISGENGAQ